MRANITILCKKNDFKTGDVLTGISSWYGPNFHGKLTANGEVYDQYGVTAAHKTLPLGTVVRVTNLDNEKSIILRINAGDEVIIPEPFYANYNGFAQASDVKVIPVTSKIEDNFAKMMGAQDLNDLKMQIEKQISGQYLQALNSITKKEILEQLEKSHNLDLPKNLIEQELSLMTKNLKPEDQEKQKEKNEKLAKSRIKLGLILNEIGEKNNLKVSDNDLATEIQKQVKNMPGQEKMILEYYNHC